MSEFDAERREIDTDGVRDGRTELDSDVDHAKTPVAEEPSHQESGYTFIEAGDPAGRGYTTPEGSHGVVYEPKMSPQGNGVGRKLLLALGVVGTVILLMGCCFLGGWAATRSGSIVNLGNTPGVDGEGNRETPETAGGFIIMDETEADSTTAPDERETQISGTPLTPDSLSTEPVPENAVDQKAPLPSDKATIQKVPAEREDKNNDGKADLVYDADGRVVTSAGEDILTIPTVVSKVAASVVEISTETLVQSNWIGQYVTSGAGSGVIIAKEGFIITNHHVIDGADSIVVRLNDGTEFNATLVGTDEKTDVAILWIDPGTYELTVATLGSSFDLVAGEDILAIGNPLGSLGGTVTEGIISATERQISVDGNDMTLLQVSAPINPGNSGGGLFNLAGELVGVVNAKMSSEEIEGLGFAIPVDRAYEIACELIEHRYVRGRATTGLTLVDVDSVQTAMYYFNSRYTGVYVYESVSDVLQYGDLILSVNGTEITKSEEISKLIRGMKVGDRVEFLVYRAKQQVTVTLELMEYVPDYLQNNIPSLTPSV